MVHRVVVSLSAEEQEALLKLSLAELRTPRDQARQVIREVLKQRGLLRNAPNGQPQEARP